MGGIFRALDLIFGCNNLMVSGSPIFLGKYFEGIPFSHIQKGKRVADDLDLGIQGQEDLLSFPSRSLR